MSTASLSGLIVTSGLAIFAFISRGDAIEQRDIARQKTLTSERTVSFVKSLFEVADPSEARGQAITAREIVDRGAARLRNDLAAEPAVKAELFTTLAEVYLGLGQFREADAIIQNSMKLSQPDPNARAKQFSVLAASHVAQGRYQAAITKYSKALKIARTSNDQSPELVSRILVGRGEALAGIEKYQAAVEDIRVALKMDLQRVGPNHSDVARDLEALGLSYFYSGELQKARPLFERSLALRQRLHGSTHPKVAENLNTLGNISYLQRDSVAAERYYREVIKRDEVVLGRDHPDLAGTLNNLARVLLERRRFREALPMLRRAIEINMQQRDVTHDDLAFVWAISLGGTWCREPQPFEEAFLTALKPARLHNHRNLGPILTDLADLYCATGRVGAALPLLDEARPVTVRDYPDDPWRLSWVNNVHGRCLERTGATQEGKRLRTESMPALAERWSRGTYYAYEASREGS